MTKEELVKIIMDDFWNEERKCYDVSGLEFPYSVDISNMKVNGDLMQDCQTANYINQNYQTTKCLTQHSQNVSGDFFDQKLKDGEEWEDWGGGGCVKRIKKLKEITFEELEKLGYKLVATKKSNLPKENNYE